jgi:Yip1 domain
MSESPALEPTSATASALSWSQAWIMAATQPNLGSYLSLAEDPSASVRKAFAWIFVSSLMGYGLATLIQLALFPTRLGGLEQSSQLDFGSVSIALMLLLCFVPLAAVLAPLSLMLVAALQQFVAGALGGQGSFSRLYYVMGAYTAPITLVTTVLSAIPILGLCLGSALGFYNLFLNALALKAVNRFGWGSALISMLVPVILVVLLIIILIFGLIYPVMTQALQSTPG